MKKIAKAKSGKSFGMLSVKAGIDKNPKPTAADRIAGAKMKAAGKAKYGWSTTKLGGKTKTTSVFLTAKTPHHAICSLFSQNRVNCLSCLWKSVAFEEIIEKKRVFIT